VKKLRLKKEPFYKERDEKEREEFDKELSERSVNTTVVYIDESGVQQEMKRTRGRARRGVKLYVETTGKRNKKVNVIAGYCNGEVLGQTTYPWNTDTEWFCMWFEFVLIPLIVVSSVIVLDNAAFHSKSYLATIAEAYGHRILFLPKYSPDKNPLEHIWATMKTWLRNYSVFYD
jgi:hypothetical protein